LDIGGDLAELKKNLAKFKKGIHGKGLDDIDIEELDFVSGACKGEYYIYKLCFLLQIENNKKVKAITILIYETSL
jgi:hypothetical protein